MFCNVFPSLFISQVLGLQIPHHTVFIQCWRSSSWLHVCTLSTQPHPQSCHQTSTRPASLEDRGAVTPSSHLCCSHITQTVCMGFPGSTASVTNWMQGNFCLRPRKNNSGSQRQTSSLDIQRTLLRPHFSLREETTISMGS